MLNFPSVTAKGNSWHFPILNENENGLEEPQLTWAALHDLHVNCCLWSHICATDMPIWSKGRDGRCRAERDRLGYASGDVALACLLHSTTDLPINLYFLSRKSSGEERKNSVYMSACDKRRLCCSFCHGFTHADRDIEKLQIKANPFFKLAGLPTIYIGP